MRDWCCWHCTKTYRLRKIRKAKANCRRCTPAVEATATSPARAAITCAKCSRADKPHTDIPRAAKPRQVSLALGENGTLYAGSSGKGILYKITGPGRASVLYDFPGEDVKAIALGAKGKVFAISNEYAELPEIPKRSAGGAAPGAPVNAARPKPGKGTLTAFDEGGRPERLLRRDDTHFTSLGVGSPWQK